ncbi:MAG: ribulose-phosphate 3-epimerase [Patescibacteria group bacterium]
MTSLIIPSILVPDPVRFLERFKTIRRYAKVAQIDVLDGKFLPFKSFADPVFINGLRPGLKFEIHLMVSNPAAELSRWNYPWVKKIIFHIEAGKVTSAVIKKVRALRKKVGLAINPNTHVAKIKPFLRQIDAVLVMTVHPGRNAAPFVSSAVEKIKQLRLENRNLEIEVDGGIKPKTAKLCALAGANSLVVGSYLKNRIFKKRLDLLKKSLK